jgi:hypothetical protein
MISKLREMTAMNKYKSDSFIPHQKENSMKKLMILFVVFCFAGCATAPEKIAPVHISDTRYADLSCEQLELEQSRLVSALTSATEAQRKTRENDIAGVIFLGLPVSSMSGSDRGAEVAKLKGELEAVQRAGDLKNCSLPPVAADQFKKKKKEVKHTEDEL